MEQTVEKGFLARVQHPVIDQAHHLEDRNHADRIRAEDEDKQRQDQRRPGVRPLVAHARLHDRVAKVLDDRLEGVHETGGYQPVLLQVPPYGRRDDEEDQRSHDPQHEHVLGHRKVDARDCG